MIGNNFSFKATTENIGNEYTTIPYNYGVSKGHLSRDLPISVNHGINLDWIDIGKWFTDIGKWFTDIGKWFTDIGKSSYLPISVNELSI